MAVVVVAAPAAKNYPGARRIGHWVRHKRSRVDEEKTIRSSGSGSVSLNLEATYASVFNESSRPNVWSTAEIRGAV